MSDYKTAETDKQGAEDGGTVAGKLQFAALTSQLNLGKSFADVRDAIDSQLWESKLVLFGKEIFIVEGALTVCTEGTDVSEFNIDFSDAKIGGKYQAHDHHYEVENVGSYDFCRIKQRSILHKKSAIDCSCNPDLTPQWNEPHDTINVGGIYQALTDQSYIDCKDGGRISFIENGQGGINQELEDFNAVLQELGFPWTEDFKSELFYKLKAYGFEGEQIKYVIGQVIIETGHGRSLVEEVEDGKEINIIDEYHYTKEKGVNLGNKKSIDGSLFRGAGILQLTGRYNYQEFANAIGDQKIMDEERRQDTFLYGYNYVAESYPIESALWYLTVNRGVNPTDTYDDISRKINPNQSEDEMEIRRGYLEEVEEAYNAIANP